MWVGLTDRINNKLEKSNLVNEHALNCEPVPLKEKHKRVKEIVHSVTSLFDFRPALTYTPGNSNDLV